VTLALFTGAALQLSDQGKQKEKGRCIFKVDFFIFSFHDRPPGLDLLRHLLDMQGRAETVCTRSVRVDGPFSAEDYQPSDSYADAIAGSPP
jgi:hypothetical protein